MVAAEKVQNVIVLLKRATTEQCPAMKSQSKVEDKDDFYTKPVKHVLSARD